MLPVNTSLGQLQIFEIYEFYNMPVLFACKNQADTIYLAVWIDETDTADIWLYISVSPQRFAKIRAGQVDLHDAFAQPEDAVVLQVAIPKDANAKAQVESIPARQMDPSWPPLAGEFLDIPAALPRVLWEGIDQRNPVTADYPKDVTPEPWYHQLAISTLSAPSVH
jgi:hypothetical protein